MAKVCSEPTQQQPPNPSFTITPAPRRPRVKEVSSRFMSPVLSSSASGDLHLPSSKHSATSNSSTNHHHHQQQQRSLSAQRRESFSYADENRLETARSLDTPFGSLNKQANSLHKKNWQHQSCDEQQLRILCHNKFPMRGGSLARSRPDTPALHGRDKTKHSPRSSRTLAASIASSTAAKLVQMNGMTADRDVPTSKCVRSLYLDTGTQEHTINTQPSSEFSEPKTYPIANQDSRCDSPVRVQNPKTLPESVFRSSMPEADLLPTISSKFLAHNRDTPKTSAFPGYRSLNSPLPSYEQQPPVKFMHRPSSSATGLPPHPSNKLGLEGRKGVKASNHQEHVHNLRMLYNHHLQWRFANAKAEAAMNVQSISAQRSFNAMAAKLSELHESVNKKHDEVTQLKKGRAISTILDAQMPYLEDWYNFDCEYSTSLSGAIKALQDTSVRLPIVQDVRADIEDVGRALNSASNVMEPMSSLVESFCPKGEEMDSLMSELAQVVNSERALVEECGELLNRTHILQVMECSLRGQVIQLKHLTSSNQAETTK